MQKIEKSVQINATKEKVWEVLLGEKTYPDWTKAFGESSTAETDWKEGSGAVFGDGHGNGMISKIEKHIPNEYLSILHLGMIKDGKEDFDSDEVKPWIGLHENYTVSEQNGVTTFKLEQDMDEQYYVMFSEMWDNAIARVKELSEN